MKAVQPNISPSWLLLFTLALPLAGCSSSQASPSPAPTSGLKKRVLVSNPMGNVTTDRINPIVLHPGNGAVDIMDAGHDLFVSTPNPLSDLAPALHIDVSGASGMATAGGTTVVINSTGNGITLIDNSKEQVTHEVPFSAHVEDVAMSLDGKTAYAAVRNAGTVAIVNTADGTASFISVPSVRRLVLSPNGSKMLAFIDDPQTLPPPNTNAFFVVDTSAKTAAAVNVTGLDHPVFGVFDNAETRAFIFNCGAECAGSTASVMLVDFSGSPTLMASVAVTGASVGLLDGGNLYVAGTPPGSTAGTAQVISTAAMTASAPVNITDGFHARMKLIDGRLYIGALTCTPASLPSGMIRGCLTIFNIATGALVFPEFFASRSSFDVTAIEPIRGRAVVYVCEGGELDIFDAGTGTFTPSQVDVVGKAVDVVQIDP